MLQVDHSQPMPAINEEPTDSEAVQQTATITTGDSNYLQERPFFSYERAAAILKPEKFKKLCGLSPRHFEIVYELMGGDTTCWQLKQYYDRSTPTRFRRTAKITLRSKLFLTLMRMRRNYALFDCSLFFNLSEMYCGQIFNTWVRYVAKIFRLQQEAMSLSAEDQERSKPECFEPFPDLRMIIDSVLVEIERFGDLTHAGNNYSLYKHMHAVRIFLGISCRGAVIYISNSFDGCASDKLTILSSNLFSILKPGDGIMVDRGYDIEAECAERKIKLYKPPKMGKKRSHFTETEEQVTKAIATTRIYVEHIMAKLRHWRILNSGKIDIHLVPILGDIVYIIGCLYNFEKVYIGVPRQDEE